MAIVNNNKKINLLFLSLSIVLTLFLPIVSLPLNIFGMIFSDGKYKKVYGFLAALSLAVLAYIWIPKPNMDLYRHHQQAEYFMHNDFNEVIRLSVRDYEPIKYLVEYTVAQLGDINLLQLIVVLCGYAGLFWMICDYSEKKNMKRWIFAMVLLFTFSAVRFINFASGLWFNLALIIVAIGVYMMFYKKTRFIHYAFFAIGVLTHISTILAIVLILLFSKIKRFHRLKRSTIAILFVVFLLFGTIVNALSHILGPGSAISSIINELYTAYFVNGDQFESLHSGWNLMLPISNIIICILCSIAMYRKGNNSTYASIVTYLGVCFLAILTTAGVFMRYGFLIVMMAVPIIAESLKEIRLRQIRIILITAILSMIILQSYRATSQAISAGLFMGIGDILDKSIFYLLDSYYHKIALNVGAFDNIIGLALEQKGTI